MTAILSICLLVVAIIIGFKMKTNVGVLCMVFAYIVGGFLLQLSGTDLMNMWPSKLFILLFAVTLFYGFAMLNGTLRKLADNIIYSFRNNTWILPIVIFLGALIISGTGAGDVSSVIFVPIAMSIAATTGMSPILLGLAAFLGSVGGMSPIGPIGILAKELAVGLKFSEAVVNATVTRILVNGLISFGLLFVIYYFVFKGYKKTKVLSMEKPEPFSREQRSTLIIIVCFIGVLVIPFLLKALFPGVAFFGFVTKNINVAFIALIGAIVASLLHVADEKQVVAHVPWSTLVVLGGVSMFIGVATKAGAIQLLSNYIVAHASSGLIPVYLAGASGIMSWFVSGFVVNATLFPLVPGIVAAVPELSPVLLFSVLVVAALTTAVSPFSTGGALVVTSIEDEKIRNRAFRWYLGIPFINLAIFILLIALRIVR